MKISILSKWFNEKDLAPFFFNHYSWADEFLIYLDSGVNDGTDRLLMKQPKAKIIWGESTGKLDDYICVTALNEIARNSDADWLIYADADEFVFPHDFSDPREYLSKADGNLIYSHMWNVFQHVDDKPLDKKQPPLYQRRHGDPIIIPECVKPNILKPSLQIHWGVGCHYFSPNERHVPSSFRFSGVHWQSVDLELACKRRIKGVKERLSERNLQNLWASHNFNVTREEIKALMKQHENDPLLF